MGLSQSYSKFVIDYPARILITGVLLVLILFILTVLIRPTPSFNEPLIGFEARDTLISTRLNAWRLLTDETSASANNLSLGSDSPTYEPYNDHVHQLDILESTNQSESSHGENNKIIDPPIIEMSTAHVSNLDKTYRVELDKDEEEYNRSINTSSRYNSDLIHYSLDSSRAFCGQLYEGYAQVVISTGSKHPGMGLLNLNSMIAICQLDQRLRLEHTIDDSLYFERDCERFRVEDSEDRSSDSFISACCNSWSIPNYIACLSNKTSCTTIDTEDINNFIQLLHLCAPHYHQAPYEECFFVAPQRQRSAITTGLNMFMNDNDIWTKSQCGQVPEKCLKCGGWIYNVMHFLVNHNFMPYKTTNDSKHVSKFEKSKQKILSPSRLTNTNIFLPIAKSSSLMKYYGAIQKQTLKTPYAQVKAMDLGLKDSLFESLLSDDTRLFTLALLITLIAISLYAWSLFIAAIIFIIICLSLCLSFSIYELILGIPIFPFMNLLAVVISFGICSDNAMLFCKHWQTQDESDKSEQTEATNPTNDPNRELLNRVDRVMRRAIKSTSIATIATACSFIVTIVSKISAIRCFCIFSTVSVITNYLLVVIFLPPALVLDSRWSSSASTMLMQFGSTGTKIQAFLHSIRWYIVQMGELYKRWLFIMVSRLRLYLIVTFITLFLCSSVLVFYRPTLQPSNEDKIQLLSSRHLFEQYDRHLRKQFTFERIKYSDLSRPGPHHVFMDTLPIRVVFGVIPDDNGNVLDPQDRGQLVFDPKFDLADPNAQTWLLDFCYKLRQQTFIHPAPAPNLSNCFMETFRTLMTRNCKDPIDTDRDYSPCCQAHKFPFSRSLFNRCIGEAVKLIAKTPQSQPNFNAGVRFFKNSTKVAALIIEYHSNMTYVESYPRMERFFNDIDEWVTWQINNMAPQSLKSGWFISSNLDLLALQTELEQGTLLSIMLEVILAFIALVVSTRDAILTISGTFTISTIICTTVATLILLKWTLGIAESIMISLTMGLSIDFALHYSIAYNESKKNGTNTTVIHWILNQVGSPIALATITTSFAGLVIIWSDILAYQQLGIFLVSIATISWSISTFLLLPLLSTVIILNGPDAKDYSFKEWILRIFKPL